MNKNLATNIVIAAVIGSLSFFGGTLYQKSQTPTFGNRTGRGNFGIFPAASGQNRQGPGQGMGRPISGEITSVDDKGVTIKLEGGSSKIIIIADSTKINKTEAGSKSDLVVGSKVTVFGTGTDTGTVSATDINLGGGIFRAN